MRLSAALSGIYAWYERNASLTACVMRDAEHHALTRDVVALRVGPVVAGWHDVLGAGLNARQRTMLHLALSFFTLRTLVRAGELVPLSLHVDERAALTHRRSTQRRGARADHREIEPAEP